MVQALVVYICKVHAMEEVLGFHDNPPKQHVNSTEFCGSKAGPDLSGLKQASLGPSAPPPTSRPILSATVTTLDTSLKVPSAGTCRRKEGPHEEAPSTRAARMHATLSAVLGKEGCKAESGPAGFRRASAVTELESCKRTWGVGGSSASGTMSESRKALKISSESGTDRTVRVHLALDAVIAGSTPPGRRRMDRSSPRLMGTNLEDHGFTRKEGEPASVIRRLRFRQHASPWKEQTRNETKLGPSCFSLLLSNKRVMAFTEPAQLGKPGIHWFRARAMITTRFV